MKTNFNPLFIITLLVVLTLGSCKNTAEEDRQSKFGSVHHSDCDLALMGVELDNSVSQYEKAVSKIVSSEQHGLDKPHKFDPKKLYTALIKARYEAKQSRLIIIILLYLFGSFAVLCFFVWRNSRRLKIKNKALVDTVNKMLDENSVGQGTCEINNSDDIVDDKYIYESPSVYVSDEDRDINRFLERLLRNNLYCNVDFERDSLLDELHIQKRNFARNFETFKGVAFSQYLTNLRLEHAVETIRRHPEYTIDAIAEESGFSSRSTFYRNFSDHFGITPTMFRDNM